MKDDEKRVLLQMSDFQLRHIARFCNRFPDIYLKYHVTLKRYVERRRTEVGPVIAPRYPGTKEEGWWLVVGDTMSNQLLAIKRVITLQRKSKVKLDFAAPAEAGTRNYTLYFMCDSYKGCDQEYNFTLNVKEAMAEDDSRRE
ncbi:hypothetical protein KY284_028387 [Solanum tuberosum]|nr:hypothetical protein KY284_028387 [Solanum tuberosum]